MKKQLLVGMFIAALVAVVNGGCATAEQKAVDQKVAAEKPAAKPGELMSRGFEAFAANAEMKADVKQKLFNIHTRTGTEAIRIRNEITKAKTVLFKELAKGDYKDKDIEILKTKITKLDQERLDVMFKALTDVEKVLGRGPEAQKYYRYLDELEHEPIHGYEHY